MVESFACCFSSSSSEQFEQSAQYVPHAPGWEPEQGAANEAAIVDRAELVHEEIGIAGKPTGRWDANAQRLGIVDELRRQGDDVSRGMCSIQQRLSLND